MTQEITISCAKIIYRHSSIVSSDLLELSKPCSKSCLVLMRFHSAASRKSLHTRRYEIPSNPYRDPLFGLIFLYRYSAPDEDPNPVEPSDDLWFANQVSPTIF